MTEIPETLVLGGDCPLHYHQSDRTPRQDTLHGLQLVTRIREISSNQTLLDNDDIAVCTAPCTITLPLARGHREFEVQKNFDGGVVTVATTAPDKILGEDGVLVYNRGTALHFKAVTGGYIII